MKKIITFLICLFSFGISAQTVLLDDDFDSYTLGFISEQAAHWTTWSGTENGGEDAMVTDVYANSGAQSMLIVSGNDMILKLGNQTSGTYTIQWDTYIPTGASGYYNFQEFEVPGNFAGQISLTVDGDFGGIATFPFDTWFSLKHIIDLDNSTIQFFIDGAEIGTYNYTNSAGPSTNLGGVDFFGAEATNEMYVDNLVFAEGVLATEQFSGKTFQVYPNPVSNRMYVQSQTIVDEVTIYDLLGKIVLQSQPGTISPSIDTSSLTSGMYMAKITSGNVSKTMKILK
ncbi:MAG TPA: T9SS type A sorting domain-containing protein [Flavobacteriaceae bacterium]|nr:T9SS type A sorting domain-containing protein [Flavobacteriaceae bacterium]